MISLICNAISSKRCLSIWYNGGIRIVEPHCYGHGNSGNDLLRCFQTSGYSLSGKSHDWKLMKVSEMDKIIILEQVFDVRPKYNPNDSAMIHYYCRV